MKKLMLLAAVALAMTVTPARASQFYANATLGLDTNDCLAATQISPGHGPCLTVAHTIGVALTTDAGGTFGRVCFSGHFPRGAMWSGSPPNSAVVGHPDSGLWISACGATNAATLDSDQDERTLVPSGAGTNVIIGGGALIIQNTYGGINSALFAQEGAHVWIIGPPNSVTFGAVGTLGGAHMHTESGAAVEITAPYVVNGQASAHWQVSNQSVILNDGYTVTCGLTFPLSYWVQLQGVSLLRVNAGAGFSYCGGIQGTQFSISGNSVIDASGNPGFRAAIPGQYPGVLSYGGIYYP